MINNIKECEYDKWVLIKNGYTHWIAEVGRAYMHQNVNWDEVWCQIPITSPISPRFPPYLTTEKWTKLLTHTGDFAECGTKWRARQCSFRWYTAAVKLHHGNQRDEKWRLSPDHAELEVNVELSNPCKIIFKIYPILGHFWIYNLGDSHASNIYISIYFCIFGQIHAKNKYI